MAGGSLRQVKSPKEGLAERAGRLFSRPEFPTAVRRRRDESRLYTRVGESFNEHWTVNHSAKEYARGEVRTNTIEGYFSVFKRGMRGVYQHCDEKHLHRYLAEFDYRYNNREAVGVDDAMRFEQSIPGIVGKRLTYRRINQANV